MAQKNTADPAFDGNFVQLLRQLDSAARQLAELPEDQEWSQEGIAIIDDVRNAAFRLAREAEACIECFQGK